MLGDAMKNKARERKERQQNNAIHQTYEDLCNVQWCTFAAFRIEPVVYTIFSSLLLLLLMIFFASIFLLTNTLIVCAPLAPAFGNFECVCVSFWHQMHNRNCIWRCISC